MEQEQAGVRFSISSPAPRRLRSIPRGGLDFAIGVEGSSRVILWPQPLVAPFLKRAACDQQCHNERRCNSNNQPRTQTTQYTHSSRDPDCRSLKWTPSVGPLEAIC